MADNYNTGSVTNNWNNYDKTENPYGVEIRSVDPFANVNSDIANNLNIIYSNENSYFTGLGIKGYTTGSVGTDTVFIIRLNPGTVMMDNVSIKFIGEPFSDGGPKEIRIPLFIFPIETINNKIIVAVDYKYGKTIPAPVAKIVAITQDLYNDPGEDHNYLKLYTFNIPGTCVHNSSFINGWNANNGVYTISDNRFETGIIFRSGDTMSGHLRIKKEPEDYNGSDVYNAVNKKYLDYNLNRFNLTNVVLKSGSINTIKTPIIWNTNRTPAYDNELITKKYVENTYISKDGSSELSGTIISTSDGDIRVNDIPKTNNSAINKNYITTAISNVLNTNSEHFPGVRKTGDTLSGPLILNNSVYKLSEISDKNKLISENYADGIYLKYNGTSSYITSPLTVDTDSYTISPDNGNISTLVTKKYCDSNYISTTSSSPFTFRAIPKLPTGSNPSSNYDIVSKKYCDDTYLKSINFESVDSDDSSGYLKLSNGFILKWGYGTITFSSSPSAGQWKSVTFKNNDNTSFEFPNWCFNVIVSVRCDPNIGVGNKDISVFVRSVTKTGFGINFGPYTPNSNESIHFYYQAIGK